MAPHILGMKYLDMVISETLRKWPTTFAVDRVCTKSYTIKPQSNYEVPVFLKPKEVIFFPIYGLHRDAHYYPNPEKFDPDRFSDENKMNIKPFTYLPFGLGPRSFETTEIPIKLSITSFNLTPNDK
ncbi:cytochrome P450 9e2-like [Zophobas morio]|uniref:cytochrome P450 9e2-like n=1 Tax=Zophobas morio TaxID=2755281 RepID=UPI0030828E76